MKTDVPALRARINDIAATRVRYGYPRIYVLLRREGWVINRKRVDRIYCGEGLSMRLKSARRRKSAMIRSESSVADLADGTWSMDFMADDLADGRKEASFAHSRRLSQEWLALDVVAGSKGNDVAQALNRIVAERGRPLQIRCDNGPGFISKALDQWVILDEVKLDCSRPEKPTDNAFIESLTAEFVKSCLTQAGSKRSITPSK